MQVHPVIHLRSPDQAITEGEKALDYGADGVFLIDHRVDYDTNQLIDAFNGLRESRPKSFIGVNLLQLSAVRALEYLEDSHKEKRLSQLPNALWADDIDGLSKEEYKSVEEMKMAIGKSASNVLLLGGIAFKYSGSYTEDPNEAAGQVERLQPFVDVVTTSGRATGEPPTVAKIHAMKQVAEKPIAVASGLNANNLKYFAGLVDMVLVASSIETGPYSGILDVAKLEEIIKAAHSIE